MTPLYVLLIIAALLVIGLLVTLARGRGPRLRGEPFRRRAFLSEAESRYFRSVSDAAGAGYRVYPKVAAAALMRTERVLGRKQRRLAMALLHEGQADLLICAEADDHPLCVVRLSDPNQGRARRRIAERVGAAFAAAGLPVVELLLTEPPQVERLKRPIHDAIEMSGVRVTTRAEPSGDAEEESLLAELAAAMRDPEPHGSGSRG